MYQTAKLLPDLLKISYDVYKAIIEELDIEPIVCFPDANIVFFEKFWQTVVGEDDVNLRLQNESREMHKAILEVFGNDNYVFQDEPSFWYDVCQKYKVGTDENTKEMSEYKRFI